MYLNNRSAPPELLHYRALMKRRALSKQEHLKMRMAERGYEGECLYDEIFNLVGHDNVYVFRDVYLKIENSSAQYDSIIINDNGAVVNEIKNYAGDYRYENGQWFNGSRRLSDNGITQVTRAANKLVNLGNISGLPFAATGKVIFPNDDFRLTTDDDKVWRKIVVRSGLKKYLRGFRYENAGSRADSIVNVIDISIAENTYLTMQADMDRLRKGIYCGSCGGFNMIKTRYHRQCAECGTKESNETHMLRVMSDYKYLFYGEGMTRKKLMILIGDGFHPEVLRRALAKYCYMDKKGKNTEYTFKYYDFDEAMKYINDTSKYRNHIK